MKNVNCHAIHSKQKREKMKCSHLKRKHGLMDIVFIPNKEVDLIFSLSHSHKGSHHQFNYKHFGKSNLDKQVLGKLKKICHLCFCFNFKPRKWRQVSTTVD